VQNNIWHHKGFVSYKKIAWDNSVEQEYFYKIGVCTLRWLIFFKTKIPQKSILIFCYHGFNGNKVNVSKEIKSILIGTQLHIWIYIPLWNNFEIWTKKNNYVKDLWKYGSILTIQKSLSKIWLWFLKEDFHIKFYYLMSHHIWSHYRSFKMKFSMNLFIFYHFKLSTNPYFCISKVHCEKWMYFYWKITT